MWIAAKQPGDPFENRDGPPRGVLTRSARPNRSYGLYLGWLQGHGQLDPDSRPIDRVDAAPRRRVCPGILHRTCAVYRRVRRAGHRLLIRATHPPDGLPWLTKTAHAMANHAEPVKSKTARMATIAELLKLGYGLMKIGEAGTRSRPSPGRASLSRRADDLRPDNAPVAPTQLLGARNRQDIDRRTPTAFVPFSRAKTRRPANRSNSSIRSSCGARSDST